MTTMLTHCAHNCSISFGLIGVASARQDKLRMPFAAAHNEVAVRHGSIVGSMVPSAMPSRKAASILLFWCLIKSLTRATASGSLGDLRAGGTHSAAHKRSENNPAQRSEVAPWASRQPHKRRPCRPCFPQRPVQQQPSAKLIALQFCCRWSAPQYLPVQLRPRELKRPLRPPKSRLRHSGLSLAAWLQPCAGCECEREWGRGICHGASIQDDWLLYVIPKLE